MTNLKPHKLLDQNTIEESRKSYYRCVDSIDGIIIRINEYIAKLEKIVQLYGNDLEIHHSENGIDIWGDCPETDHMVIRRLNKEANLERTEREMLASLLKKYPQ